MRILSSKGTREVGGAGTPQGVGREDRSVAVPNTLSDQSRTLTSMFAGEDCFIALENKKEKDAYLRSLHHRRTLRSFIYYSHRAGTVPI
jgi:hypothetical protein